MGGKPDKLSLLGARLADRLRARSVFQVLRDTSGGHNPASNSPSAMTMAGVPSSAKSAQRVGARHRVVGAGLAAVLPELRAVSASLRFAEHHTAPLVGTAIGSARARADSAPAPARQVVLGEPHEAGPARSSAGTPPSPAPTTVWPLLRAGRDFALDGTPAIVMADGELLPGYVRRIVLAKH